MQAKKFAFETGITLGSLTTQALLDYMQKAQAPQQRERFLMPVFGGRETVAHSPEEIAKLRDEGR